MPLVNHGRKENEDEIKHVWSIKEGMDRPYNSSRGGWLRGFGENKEIFGVYKQV